jgi:signal-transduction protein with cAMP-binding, CBS, and nucleotidyltransferase domain
MVTTDNKIHTPVSRLMTTDFAAVDPWDTLGEAVERMTDREGSGIGTRGRLRAPHRHPHVARHPPCGGRRTHSSEARVREWMSGDPRVALADTPAEEAALMMVEQGCHHLPVVENGRPIGVVGMRAVVSDTIEPVLD